eukprot:UN32386
MLTDKNRGIKTEIEQINGYIAKLTDAPLNTLLTNLINYDSKTKDKNMKIVKKTKDLCILREKRNNKRISFVPFLGGLHEAHLALVDEAKKHGDEVWCSLFINKLQFNSNADFEAYPQTMQEDLRLLRERGVDVVYTPELHEMYPLDEKIDFPPRVVVPNIEEKTLEGKVRPGHFGGVATVLMKLFNYFRPHTAVFGEKDFIQTVVVQKLQAEYFPTLKIIV